MFKKSLLNFPLNYLLIFFGLGLLITTFSRIALFFLFYNRVSLTEDYWLIFPIGLRSDVILMSYLSSLPAIFLLLPKNCLKFGSSLIRLYCSCCLLLILFTELATPQFIQQYDTRPNQLFLDYLIYPKEVFNTLIKSYWGTLLLTLVMLIAAGYGLLRYGTKWFKLSSSKYSARLLWFLLVAGLLVCGARGSLTSRRPINTSNAFFSTDSMTNSLGLNSFYNLLYAIYLTKNERNPLKMYGIMSEEEAYRRVRKYMFASQESFSSPEIPFLHKAQPNQKFETPYNIVIFLQESLGAEFVGCLGGLPLTPNFDELAQGGVLFTNLYATGTRSVRGMEAVVAGFLPSPSESVLKLSNSQTGFFTLAELLRRRGYDTSFIYGGMANFDNMASFYSGNGFGTIIDETKFNQDGEKYTLKGTWGYSDEDLVRKANSYFKNLEGKPFFSLMFSTSNHEPFEFPEGRIELYEQPQATVHNAIKYADFAIGEFFKLAREEEYFENTIFIIVADHNTRTFGKNLVPIHKFKIPALIIAPHLAAGRYDKLASQLDLPVTLLGLLGFETEHPMPGRNLLTLPQDVPGRALMQFMDINAFRVEDQVVIQQPNKPPLQFKVLDDSTLLETELDPELAQDALAHTVAAKFLYKNKKYKLRENAR